VIYIYIYMNCEQFSSLCKGQIDQNFLDQYPSPVIWTITVTGPRQTHRIVLKIPDEKATRMEEHWLYEQASKRLGIPLSRFNMPSQKWFMCPWEYPVKSRHSELTYN